MLQTTLIDMEWNTKLDWENLDIFSSKAVTIASPKKLQSTEEIDNSFNLSGIFENNSSTKSSISASNFSLEGSRSFHETYNKKKESVTGGSPPSFEGSVCSSDQSIGLKLGKRTYFENNSDKNNTKTCNSPNAPISTVKKVKLSHQSTPITPRCQVEGCNLDLSSSKEYHRKHKVCEVHSKSLKVVVAGLERRFCQQCSRFHGLAEFDGKKRSCRRRLSDHNARRRKPQQETIQFNSTTLSSSFYDRQQQQLSFVFNNVPQCSMLPTMKAEVQFPNAAGVFDQGSNAEALDLRRVLSLLSNSSCQSDFSELGPTMAAHHGLPPDYWQLNRQSVDHVTQFQESQVLKSAYGMQYVNPMDEFLKPL